MVIQRKSLENRSSWYEILWYVQEENLDDERRWDIIPPSGHIHIVYNLADPYTMLEGDEQLNIPDIIIAGQLTQATRVHYGQKLMQLGIAMDPIFFYGIYGKPASLYTGLIIDCSDWPGLAGLHEDIIRITSDNKKNPEVMMDLIESRLSQIVCDYSEIEIYHNMYDYIVDRKGLIDTKDMADTFGYSVSSLERNFKKVFGLTPKKYSDIMRFRFAMMEDDPRLLFYDQSHYIKYCKKYTNTLPSDLSDTLAITLSQIFDTPVE